MKRSIVWSGCLASGGLLSCARAAAPDPVPAARPPFVPVIERSLAAVMRRLQEGSDGKTPAVKAFEQARVKALFERGNAGSARSAYAKTLSPRPAFGERGRG